MRATVMFGAGDVRVVNVPDAAVTSSTDAVVRVTRAAICGSDLWPYKSLEQSETGQRMGHEIYLGDPRRAAPDKLKTLIRQPIQRAS